MSYVKTNFKSGECIENEIRMYKLRPISDYMPTIISMTDTMIEMERLQFDFEQTNLTPFEWDDILRQCVHILAQLKIYKVRHCDIKLENLMHDERGKVYLIDWEFAMLEGETDDYFKGTAEYMSPELQIKLDSNHNEDYSYSYESDTYAMGKLIQFVIEDNNLDFPMWNEISNLFTCYFSADRACPIQTDKVLKRLK
jgi:serine/threonine protein kinase